MQRRYTSLPIDSTTFPTLYLRRAEAARTTVRAVMPQRGEGEGRTAEDEVVLELALWTILEGMVPSVNEAPHWDWRDGAKSEIKLGAALNMML